MITKEYLDKHSYSHPIVLYDGNCLLCSKSVQWIIKEDTEGILKFCALQSVQDEPYKLNGKYDTVYLLENGEALTKSRVSLRILQLLRGKGLLIFILKSVPLFIRDFIYDIVARNRYNWFGQKENCLLMTEEIRNRIILEKS